MITNLSFNIPERAPKSAPVPVFPSTPTAAPEPSTAYLPELDTDVAEATRQRLRALDKRAAKANWTGERVEVEYLGGQTAYGYIGRSSVRTSGGGGDWLPFWLLLSDAEAREGPALDLGLVLNIRGMGYGRMGRLVSKTAQLRAPYETDAYVVVEERPFYAFVNGQLESRARPVAVCAPTAYLTALGLADRLHGMGMPVRLQRCDTNGATGANGTTNGHASAGVYGAYIESGQ